MEQKSSQAHCQPGKDDSSVSTPTTKLGPFAHADQNGLTERNMPADRARLDVANVANGEDLIEPEVRMDAKGKAKRHRIMRMDFPFPMIQGEESADGAPTANARDLEQARIADHLLITAKPGTDQAQIQAMAQELGMNIRKRIGSDNIYLVSYPVQDFDSQERARAALAGRQEVALADYDLLITVSAIPNDPSYGSLWNMNRISAPQAWDRSTGSRNVVIGVIDSGIDYNHPELSPNIWTNPGESGQDAQGRDKRTNGVDDDGNGYVDDWRGWDFIYNDNDPMDHDSHGTHVAGIIGAVGNNGIGVAGVCWQVSMAALKMLGDDGAGTSSSAVEAIRYSANMGIEITSNSWGSSYSPTINNAIEYAASRGQLFVAAAGNANWNNDLYQGTSPSSSPSENVIAVMATGTIDIKSSYSNYGLTRVDLAAPGDNITSTMPGGGYGVKSGTSMATPHVTGACAMIKALMPSLTATEIKAAIMNGVDPLPDLQDKCVTGGRLNLFKSVSMAGGPEAQLRSYAFAEAIAGDGHLNPGEEAVGTITLANNLILPVTDVVVRITTSDPQVTILTNSVNYGTLNYGQSSNGNGAFRLRLAPSASPRMVDLTLTITHSSGNPMVIPITCAYVNSSAISGYVRNGLGAPVAGATVSWTGIRSGQVTSSSNGYYAIPEVDGTYTVTASATGFINSSPTTLTVPPSRTQDLVLGFRKLSISPTSLSFQATPGQTAAGPLSLTSAGSLPVTWSIPTNSHQFTTSDQPGGPAYVWNDISVTGTQVTGLLDDTNLGPFPLGFSMPFYGQNFTGIRICSNGWMSFTSSSNTYKNASLPNSSLPENLIAPLMRDLNLRREGTVHYQQSGEDTFIIQFTNAPRFQSPSLCTFQVVIKRDGTILFYYKHIDEPTIGTVGIQNSSKTDGLTIAHNQAFLRPEMAIQINVFPSWLSVTPTSGSLAAGSASTVMVNCNASGLAAGTYQANLIVNSNDTRTPIQSTHVSFIVGGTQPIITAWPTASSIIYGQPLSTSTLSGGTASVAGSFAFNTPSTVLGVGTHNAAVTFTPTLPGYTQAQGTVSVMILPANTAPVAIAQSMSTTSDTSKTINLTGNDADGDSLSFSIVNPPTNGVLSGSGATRIYTPATSYVGTDSFTFKVNDGTVDSVPATVSITVSASDRSTPWSPHSLRLLAWYDAADTTTIISDGVAVSQWHDKSGYNYHATQSSLSRRPTLAAGGIQFGSNNAHFIIPKMSSDTYSIMMVLKNNNTINSNSAAQMPISIEALSNGPAFGSSTGTYANEVISMFDEDTAGIFGDRQSASNTQVASISNAPHLISFVLNQNWHIGLDGSNDMRNLSAGTRHPFLTSQQVGAIGTNIRKRTSNNIIEHSWTGLISEIILLPTAVSLEDRQKIEGYLAHKWDAINGNTTLVAALPQNHPWKSVAPESTYRMWAGVSGYDLVGGPNDDDDSDGLNNFNEFAFGTNPVQADGGKPVHLERTNKELVIRYERKSYTGLNYTLWTSNDLSEWSLLTTTNPPILIDQKNGIETVEVVVTDPPADESLFIRVKAE